MKFRTENRQHIQEIFTEKTGVVLPGPQRKRLPFRAALIAAVLACALSLTVWGYSLFSPLSGDDFALSAQYEGDGIVAVTVENRSDKTLSFQPLVKVMCWSTGEEIAPHSDGVVFDNTVFSAGEKGTMTIDLSQAYDVEELESLSPLDGYYLLLTNLDFVFGHDWMCTVSFSLEPAAEPTPTPMPTPVPSMPAVPPQLPEGAQGKLVPAVDPEYLAVRLPEGAVLDESLSRAAQDQLWQSHWTSRGPNRSPLATDGEHAIEICALLPSSKYPDTFVGVPLLYLFTYERSEVDVGQDYAYICGQTIPFSQLEDDLVYQDEQYLCYELSELVYGDLDEYLRDCVSQTPEIAYDDHAEALARSVYNQFRQSFDEAITRRETPLTIDAYIPVPQGP